MDTFRYLLAVLAFVSYPPAVAWWFLLHPFVRFWRRLGAKASLWILGSLFLAASAALFTVRDRFLADALGTDWRLIAAAVPLLATSAVVRRKRRREFDFRRIAGVPELAPGQDDDGLVTTGIYGRIRHPRYVELCLAALGWALVANYLTVYWLTAGLWLGIFAIVLLEERELRQRFGQAYVDYCARVPRWIPRLGGS